MRPFQLVNCFCLLDDDVNSELHNTIGIGQRGKELYYNEVYAW